MFNQNIGFLKTRCVTFLHEDFQKTSRPLLLCVFLGFVFTLNVQWVKIYQLSISISEQTEIRVTCLMLPNVDAVLVY